VNEGQERQAEAEIAALGVESQKHAKMKSYWATPDSYENTSNHHNLTPA
jgi:hypothetical protein